MCQEWSNLQTLFSFLSLQQVKKLLKTYRALNNFSYHTQELIGWSRMRIID